MVNDLPCPPPHFKIASDVLLLEVLGFARSRPPAGTSVLGRFRPRNCLGDRPRLEIGPGPCIGHIKRAHFQKSIQDR